MKTPYSQLSIERLENAVKNHGKSLRKLKKSKPPPGKKTLYLAEWRLKTAKKWLQKRNDARDMKNH